ncbi:MAG: SMP-30/gluconolactonase/LRE family protein [Gemmatimonadales bacterium]
MHRRHALALAIVALAACKKQEQAARPAADTAFTVRDSFRTPESVLYDAAADIYLVSNVNGAAVAKDNNGFISRVSPDGHVLALKFIEGGRNGATLNAPKGMGIHGDTLFVADIDELRMFSRTSGAALGSKAVPGATFLNDVDVAPDGAVYFSDSGLKPDFSSSGTDAVYRLDRTGLHKIAHGTDLARPNGVLADSAGVTVVAFGANKIYHLDLQGHRTNLPDTPHGQLDGIVRLADGTLLVSSWEDSSVVGMKPGATMYMMVAHGIESPADIGLDTKRNRLLVPSFNGNRIEVRPIAPAASGHGQ